MFGTKLICVLSGSSRHILRLSGPRQILWNSGNSVMQTQLSFFRLMITSPDELISSISNPICFACSRTAELSASVLQQSKGSLAMSLASILYKYTLWEVLNALLFSWQTFLLVKQDCTQKVWDQNILQSYILQIQKPFCCLYFTDKNSTYQ